MIIRKREDCNDCSYLNITEEQQRINGNKEGHYCNKYNKPVYHMGNKLSKYDPYLIHPCKECDETYDVEKEFFEWLFKE